MSTQITRNDLLKFEHSLHDKLRGGKGIKLTGLPALNEMENIFLFRFIEENKEVNLPNDIKFTFLCEKYATDEKIKEDKKIPILKDRNCYKLWHTFYNANNDDFILGQYFKNEFIRKYIKSSVNKISAFTEEKKQDISQTIQELFNLTYNKFKNINFDSTLYDMFGSSHEQFKTDEHGNGGKGTGQHFTPQDIKFLIVEEVKPKAEETFYEPCAGSGGMIHTADQYVRNNEPKEYKKFKKNIYANECNPELIKPLMINMLLHNIPVDNIHEQDSLSYDNIKLMKDIADIIMTNYPFGMSNTIDLNDYPKMEDYWKILTRGKGNKSVIKNSSGQFVLHIYHSLKKNGRTGFVSDRGIIYNGDSSTFEGDIRKFLVENGNLYKIVLLPTGIFPYTPFATCVIFYKKGETTKTLAIYEGKFKDIKAKKGLYVEDLPIKTFTLEELRKNGYCFKTEEKIDVIQKGWVKLGDVIEFNKKSIHKAGDALDSGKYTYYTSSSITKKSNYCDYIDYHIILGTGGNVNVNYDNNFSCSADNFILKLNSLKYTLKFIYYFLKINISILNNGFIGNGLKHLNKQYTEDIQIPSLSLSHQEEIVSFLDEQFKLYDINLLSPIIKDIPLFDLLINKKYDAFADAMHIIYRKLEADAMQQTFSRDMKSIFNLSVHSVKSKEYKLGDLVEYSKKKWSLQSSDGKENGKYNFYSCSKKQMYYDTYEFEMMSLIINRGGTPNIRIDSKFCISHDDIYVLTINSDKVHIKYIYNFIKFNLNIFSKLYTGGGIKHISKESINTFKINIPSLEDQEKIIKQIERIESTQTDYKTYGDVLQGQIDMMSVSIKNITNIPENNIETENIVEQESAESEPVPIVKTKSKKSSKVAKVESPSSSEDEEAIITKVKSSSKLESKQVVKKSKK